MFQIGTAKNGVRDIEGNLNDDRLREIAAHPQVKMFEIKMSQGPSRARAAFCRGQGHRRTGTDPRGQGG